MVMLAATKLIVLNIALAGWWWTGTLDEVSKRDVASIAKSLEYTATEENASDPSLKISTPKLTFWTYLEDCRMKSGEYLEQCSKVKFQTCWNLSEFGFYSTRNVAEFANEYNRLGSPTRKFDMAYAFITSGGRLGCLNTVFYLNDGVSSQYIGASMRTFVRAADEFQAFAKNWK